MNFSSFKSFNRLGDLSDFPDEISCQFRYSKVRRNKMTRSIIEVINKLDGAATTDEIFAWLYRADNSFNNRQKIATKLGRLVHRGELCKKGSLFELIKKDEIPLNG